jgi:hypothetical protein
MRRFEGGERPPLTLLQWPSRENIILEAIGTIVYISDLQTGALIKVFDPCIHLAHSQLELDCKGTPDGI